MKKIQQTYTINAPLGAVWQALTDPAVIERWGGGPVTMSVDVGSGFSMWGGEIHGTNTKVINQELLVQDWWSRETWNQPSRVTFTFSNDGQSTTVDLLHVGVPDNAVDDISEGWKTYYFDPIKEFLRG